MGNLCISIQSMSTGRKIYTPIILTLCTIFTSFWTLDQYNKATLLLFLFYIDDIAVAVDMLLYLLMPLLTFYIDVVVVMYVVVCGNDSLFSFYFV